MAGLFTKGTKLFYGPVGTSWTALTAGTYPGSPWVEAGCLDGIKPKFTDNTITDDWCLGDLYASKSHDIQPGQIPFTLNHDAANLKTLMGIQAPTQKDWAIVLTDGSALVGKGKLVMDTGDITKGKGNKVTYEFIVHLDEIMTLKDPS